MFRSLKTRDRRPQPARPRNVLAENTDLVRGEQVFVLRIAQNGKAGFLMRHLRPKRIDHTDSPVSVRACQWMIRVAPLQKLMNDDALVNDIDAKTART